MSVLLFYRGEPPQGGPLQWAPMRSYLPITKEQAQHLTAELAARTGVAIRLPKRGQFGWVKPTLTAIARAAKPRNLAHEWKLLRPMLRDLYLDRRFLLEDSHIFITPASLHQACVTLSLAATLGFPVIEEFRLHNAKDWCAWIALGFRGNWFQNIPYRPDLPMPYPERIQHAKAQLLRQMAHGLLILAQDTTYQESPLQNSVLYTIYRLGDLAGLYFHLRGWHEEPLLMLETPHHQQYTRLQTLAQLARIEGDEARAAHFRAAAETLRTQDPLTHRRQEPRFLF